jgi:hypothetical protein
MTAAGRRRRVLVAGAGGALATARGRATTPAAGPAQPRSGKVTGYTAGDEPPRQACEKRVAGFNQRVRDKVGWPHGTAVALRARMGAAPRRAI